MLNIYSSFRIISCRFCFSNRIYNKILRSKHFIAQQFQLRLFVIVNADENHAIIAQQGFC